MSDLRSSTLHAVVGESHRLRDATAQALIAGWEGPVKRHVEPEELQRIVLDLATASLFEAPTLHLVRATAAWVKRHRERFDGLPGRAVDGGVLVLITDPPERKDDALMRALGKVGALHVADEPDAKGFIAWLATQISQHPQGAEHPKRIADLLADHVGTDVDACLSALEVVALVRPNFPLSPQSVEELYDRTAAKPLFSFCDAVLSGDAAQALTQLHAVGAERPESALQMLAAELRKVVACTEHTDDAEASAAAGAFGRPNLWFTRKRAQVMGRTTAMRLFTGVLQAQRSTRQGGGTNAGAAVELLVLHARKLLRPGGR